ncbi:hypothetical protein BJY24_003649 [Nocardia transvalensis]|uniref:Uncharacterized protein n=1 Tax=Nocardia transvalensis TaxID=37333 RepID=A0A7W9PER8_9NOCA|nr:hypothetical protein [Nocardia transvalensis]
MPAVIVVLMRSGVFRVIVLHASNNTPMGYIVNPMGVCGMACRGLAGFFRFETDLFAMILVSLAR